MKQTGILWTCDRCGKTEFREIPANEGPIIGNWCHPKGRSNVHGVDLCPDCEKIYIELFEKYLNNE